MRCNFKKNLRAERYYSGQTKNTVKRLWELLALIALHREFGFGAKRLKQFADSLNDIYDDFMKRASVTDKFDKKRRELTDIDSAIIFALRELRRSKIDHRDILGGNEKLVIIDEHGKQTDLDDLLDRIEGR